MLGRPRRVECDGGVLPLEPDLEAGQGPYVVGSAGIQALVQGEVAAGIELDFLTKAQTEDEPRPLKQSLIGVECELNPCRQNDGSRKEERRSNRDGNRGREVRAQGVGQDAYSSKKGCSSDEELELPTMIVGRSAKSDRSCHGVDPGGHSLKRGKPPGSIR